MFVKDNISHSKPRLQNGDYLKLLAAVCGMHGAGGGAPTGKLNGQYSHGAYTFAVKNAQSHTRALMDECNEYLDRI